jgi:hypothetical protein
MSLFGSYSRIPFCLNQRVKSVIVFSLIVDGQALSTRGTALLDG